MDGSLLHIGELVQTGDDVRSSKCWADSPEQKREEDNMACACPRQMMSHAAGGWRKEGSVMDY